MTKFNPKFYVYLYLDQNNVPFYVGKGCGNRYKICYHLNTRYSKFLQNKIKSIGQENIVIKVLYKDLTEEQAFCLEEKYIAGFGRRDLGLGPLCNQTNGGDGESGKKLSDETKKKMSAAKMGNIVSEESRRKISSFHSGNKYWLGKKHSEDTKKKMSVVQKGHFVSEETKLKISQAQRARLAKKGAKCPTT